MAPPAELASKQGCLVDETLNLAAIALGNRVHALGAMAGIVAQDRAASGAT